MQGKYYLFNKDSKGVAKVSLNRPEIHNAFNDELIAELTGLFDQMSDDPSVRLVVLTGEGRSFCAGADLNWMKSMVNYSEEENYKDSRNLAGLFESIDKCSKPVIGRINGAALGGGVGVVSVCDYVIAVDRAKFGFTEARLGLVPATISPFVIAKIGQSHARATFLSGTRFDAKKAYQIGLVHEVVSEDKLDEATEKAINEHLMAGPEASKVAKSLIENVIKFSSEGEEKLTDYTCKTIAKIRISKEGQDGMNALLEKRKPSWQAEL